MTELSAQDMSTLASKLSSFMNDLSEPEREFLADVLASAGSGDQSPEVEGFGLRNSDRMQSAILANDQAINNQQRGMNGIARDRRRAGLDNIQKFLDITRSMNPKI